MSLRLLFAREVIKLDLTDETGFWPMRTNAIRTLP